MKQFLPARLVKRSAANVAYTNGLVSVTGLSNIRCIQAAITGSQDRKQHVSNAVDFPVVCGGDCSDYCGLIPYREAKI